MAEHSDAVGAGRLAEARRYVDRHLADPDLSPAGVAAALRISVRALHLLFEPTGTSFSRTVVRRGWRNVGRRCWATPHGR
jgi:AraC-like DNA-binding protein